MTKLCDLAYKYGADKCPQVSHPYTPFYYELFKNRKDSIKKVIEIGIGTSEYMNYYPEHYVTGASLRMWRDFFPNAQIYGADILPEAMFEDERIKTFMCDETKEEDLVELIKKTGSDIDIFIDDAIHKSEHQIFMCQTLMPLLKKDVIYIIEDVLQPGRMIRKLGQYHGFAPDFGEKHRLPKVNVVVIKNK